MTVRTLHRRSLIGATAAVLSAALAGGALAEPVTVSVSLSSGGRQLALEDLTGDPLTALDLGSGGSMPFRVQVTDTLLSGAGRDFTVDATMTNLYLDTGSGTDYTDPILSSDVSIAVAPSAVAAADGSVIATPRVDLSGGLGSCTTLSGLGGALTGILLDLSATTLCTLLGVGGLTLPVGTEVLGTPITLDSLDTSALPLGLGSGSSGAFGDAEYTQGVGTGDTARASGAPAATVRTLLSGTGQVPAALISALSTAVSGLPVVSSTGTGALTSTSTALAGLLGSANSTVSSLGAAISAISSASTRTALLNQLTATVSALASGDLTSVSGTYSATPVLTVDAGDAPAGDYVGTLTVTLVQP